MDFEFFSIGKLRCLVVMAAPAEYGPELKKRIKPLMIGVGPVEASINTTSALSKLQHQNDMPDLVLSLGSAGSNTLEQGHIYQVSHVSYRDMDASALGFKKGLTPFLNLPHDVAPEAKLIGVPEARLATGASVVSGAAYQGINADMVDMETFAILRVCHHFDVPLLGLRGISDGNEELHHYDDWTRYLHELDHKLALILDSIEETLILPS